MVINLSPELAEICGIHAGDGYLRNDGKRAELDISGNLDEQEYYDVHVAELFQKEFNINISPQIFKSRNTYGFVIRDKRVIEFMHLLGFPFGSKTYTVHIPKIILTSKDKVLFARFLRGLFDTDGHLGFRKFYGKYIPFKTTKHHYPSVQLTTVSKNLVKDVKFLLSNLGFTYNVGTYNSKLKSEHTRYKITINNACQVRKWIQIVGTKNNSKFSRYLIWEKFGFCPTKLSFNQRKDILNGKLDINSVGP
jgi:intein/homing endonuclease